MTKETELREHSRFATFRKGTSNKFYQVRVVEREDTCADVLFVYGRIGTAGQTKEQIAGYFEQGVIVADQQFEKKLSKGYVEQKSSLVLLAMTMEEPEERKGHGLQAVDVSFVQVELDPQGHLRALWKPAREANRSAWKAVHG